MKELLVLGEAEVAQGTLRDLGFSKRKGWTTGSVNLYTIVRRRSLPDITVVEVSQGGGREFDRVVWALAAKQDTSQAAAFVLMFMSKKWPEKNKIRFLKRFPSPDRVRLYPFSSKEFKKAAVEAIEPNVEVLRAHLAKLQNPEGPQPSVLDKMQKVLDTTKDLRSDRGNLSAKLISDLYEIPTTQLARWLGKTKQTLFKTPDADSVQAGLEYFERIARLRVAVSDADFRKWLKTANPLLDDKTPLELIFSRKGQVVADLVADMITGRPN
jgi:Protein of unknown function (DUF2384)